MKLSIQKQWIVLLVAVLGMQAIAAQVKKTVKSNPNVYKIKDKPVVYDRVTDTTTAKKIRLKDELRINPLILEKYHAATIDTVWDLKPFLASKQNCEFEKAIDSNGCVLVKYADGLTKKICGGKLVEVITPDGRKHVARLAGSTLYMYVIPIPSPGNPSTEDLAYNWLAAYNANLLNEITGLLGGDQSSIDRYTSREKIKCSNNIYKEIEYRTIFIEEVLKAK